MTKFEKYLNEKSMKLTDSLKEDIDDLIQSIKRECKPWLSSIKGCTAGRRNIWRGIDSNDDMLRKTVRTDRRPADTVKETHERNDKLFNRVYGWKPRSSGLFVNGGVGIATSYGFGEPFLVFPIGKYIFLWSNTIQDLYATSNRIESDKKLTDMIRKSYSDKNICRAISSQNEIMISCKSYYALKYSVIGLYLGKSPKSLSVRNADQLAEQFLTEYIL